MVPLFRLLQSLSLLIANYVQGNSTSIPVSLYQSLPFLCQFNGQENLKNQDVGQQALRALGYLSVCIVKPEVWGKQIRTLSAEI